MLTSPADADATDDETGHEGATTALPVIVEVAGGLGAEVRRYLESVLGWQPVDAATAPVVPPALRCVGASSPVTGGPSGGDSVPSVLLLDEETDLARAADLGAQLRPDATLRWPMERERLATVAAGLLRRPRPHSAATEVVRIGGASGGVGTSTVALALAGLSAWRRRRVLAVVGSGAPVLDAPHVSVEALTAPGLLRRARTLPGVPGAVVVESLEAPRAPVGGVIGVGLVVLDVGRQPDVDVLVCRPDRAGLRAAAATTAGIVVVNGTGAAGAKDLATAAGGRRRIELPWSARVARAGLHARVPASLPGSWLRRLLPAVPDPVADPIQGQVPDPAPATPT